MAYFHTFFLSLGVIKPTQIKWGKIKWDEKKQQGPVANLHHMHICPLTNSFLPFVVGATDVPTTAGTGFEV